MPRIDMFGKSWRTGEDLAMDSAIRTLGGIGNMVNYWAQYSDQIKEEERKKQEELAKQEAEALKQEEAILNEYSQLKALREDLPDDVAFFIAQMPQGPYKSTLTSNVKTPRGTLADIAYQINPFAESKPLDRLINFYNEGGNLKTVNQMQDMVLKSAEQSGISPQEFMSHAIEQGIIDPQYASLIADSFATPEMTMQSPSMRTIEQAEAGRPTGLMPTGRGMSTSELLRTGVQGLTSAITAPLDWRANIANMLLERTQLQPEDLAGFDPFKDLGIEKPEITKQQQEILESSRERYGTTPKVPTLKGAISSLLPEGYLTPTNEAQQILNDFIGDTSMLVSPLVMGKNLKQVGQLLGRGAQAAGVGNFLKWGAKKLGGGPLVQEGLRLASLLYLGTGIEEGVAKEISNQFNISHAIGETTPLNTSNIVNTVKDEFKKVSRQGPGTDAYKAVKDTIENMYEHFLGEGIGKTISKDVSGTLSVAQQEQALADLFKNSNATAAQMQDFVSGGATRVRQVGGSNTDAGKALDNLFTSLRKTLMDPATSSHTYANAYRPAVEGYKQLKDADKVINWINDKLPAGSYLSTRGILFKLGGKVISEGIYKPVMTTAMALKKIATDPQFAKAYATMGRAAIEENVPLLLRSADIVETSLNKTIKKEKDKEERFRMRQRNLNQLIKRR